jgi:DNA-binding NtrC family response regulator
MDEPHSLLKPLIEVLTDAREGAPRWVTVETTPAADVAALVRRASVDGDARGFVPIGVDAYMQLREVRGGDLADRTLLLIAPPGTKGGVSRRALVHASSQSSRPHVLVAIRSATAVGPNVVREARVAYGVAREAPLPEEVERHVRRASRAGELTRAGCHAAAERLLREVRGVLTRRKAWSPAASIGVVLGRLVLERGRATDAVAICGDAAGCAEAGGDERGMLAARIWQAAARIDAGQLVAAEAQCRAVLAVNVLPEHEQSRVRATLARTLLWQDRAEEAAELGLSAVTSTTDLDPYVSSTSIRVLLERGKLFEAGQLARELMTLVQASSDPLARVIALTGHLRVLLTIGDLALASERLEEIRQAARAARAPLRLARARVMLVDALRRSGRTSECARELAWLRRISGGAPPLLRAAIDRRLRDRANGRAIAGTRRVWPAGVPAAAPMLVAMARDEDDDRAAVSRILHASAGTLRTSRVDLHSADAGPVTVLLSAGAGLATGLGARVLEAGIAIGPEAHDHGLELSVPVRLGPTLLAALGARWPADRTPPAHAREWLELAAAVAAPRIEAMLASKREEATASVAVAELVGPSACMAEVRRAVTKAAAAPFAALIEGESGVGKELVARAIHQLGPRRERRFGDVNCAALPDDLLESELFGHARGAFTGAVTERAGLFEDADGGTLFLDEVADLSPRAQAKLLRVVQQQEVRRVGETFSRKIDVRIVAAANRDVRREATEGRFRQDLLYRLDVIRIRIPPLRERPDDVPALAAHFWRMAAARVASTAVLTHGVLAALARYHWPGNVRELQNVMSALAVAAPSRGLVRPGLLPAAVTGVTTVRAARLSDARAQFERRFVEVALARAGGSRTRAARDLGVSRQGLLKILGRVGIS